MSEEAPQKFQRLHLYSPSNKKLSGKGVRYVELSLQDIDQIELDLLRAEPDINRLSLNKKETDAILETSIRFVTTERVPLHVVVDVPEKDGKPAVQHLEPDWDKAIWKPVNAMELKIKKNEIFKTADQIVLRSVFAEEYNVSQQDMDAILLGKATELVE